MGRGLPCIGQEALWITNKSISLLQPLRLLFTFLGKNTHHFQHHFCNPLREIVQSWEGDSLLKKERIILIPLITSVQQVQPVS